MLPLLSSGTPFPTARRSLAAIQQAALLSKQTLLLQLLTLYPCACRPQPFLRFPSYQKPKEVSSLQQTPRVDTQGLSAQRNTQRTRHKLLMLQNSLLMQSLFRFLLLRAALSPYKSHVISRKEVPKARAPYNRAHRISEQRRLSAQKHQTPQLLCT